VGEFVDDVGAGVTSGAEDSMLAVGPGVGSAVTVGAGVPRGFLVGRFMGLEGRVGVDCIIFIDMAIIFIIDA